MASILASVVIPSYNCAPWLERSVLSALALSRDQIEVVIVDDGSVDDTPRICDDLKERHPQVRVIRQTNSGLSMARNAGIAISRGDYIILLDADDVLAPFDLASLVSGDFDLIRVGVEIKQLDGTCEYKRDSFGPAKGVNYLKDRLRAESFFIASWAYFYRRQWLQEQGLKFVPGLLHEDHVFTIEAILKAQSFIERNTLAYHYFIREGSITTALDSERICLRIASLIYIVEHLYGCMKQHPDINFIDWLRYNIDTCYYLSQKIESLVFNWPILKMELRLMTYHLYRRDFRSARGVTWRVRRAFEAVLFSRLGRHSLKFKPASA